jgi:peptide/nickel transport system ATP-binding protein
MTDLLDVQNLWVKFPSRTGTFDAVRGVSFRLGRERLGIVGESGSGKSMTGRAILRLIRKPGIVEADHIKLDGEDLLKKTEKEMRSVRGSRISMVMQDPKFSLNPVMRVGEQIVEAYRLHSKASRTEARRRALEMLEAVSIRDPGRVFRAFPHELSGGMGQRIMIAMMLIPNPELLIADEPTSALDVSVQAEILNLLSELRARHDLTFLMVSHNLAVVAHMCSRIAVMKDGEIVEIMSVEEMRAMSSHHPYTKQLLEASRGYVRDDAAAEEPAGSDEAPALARKEAAAGEPGNA